MFGHVEKATYKAVESLNLIEDYAECRLVSLTLGVHSGLGSEAHCRNRIADLMCDPCSDSTDRRQALARRHLSCEIISTPPRYGEAHPRVI
jgi:hypothetical protein